MDISTHRPPQPRHRLAWGLFTAIALALLAGAAGWWWLTRQAPELAITAPPSPAPTAMPAPQPPVAAQAPAPEPEPAPPSQPFAEGDAVPALEAVVGREAVLRLLQTTNLPQRIVATVDNLARDSAPASMWPVNPTGDAFRVIERSDGGVQVDPDNMLRYAPLVLLAEQVDLRQVADWYRRALPLLQPAYEQLGYPGQRFHSRLLAVLDHLLATPPAPQPLLVQLTEVRGPVPSTRPWVRYEFADPAMERASAGRKILWRVGPVNQRRLMAVLAAFRDELRAGPR